VRILNVRINSGRGLCGREGADDGVEAESDEGGTYDMNFVDFSKVVLDCRVAGAIELSRVSSSQFDM
jgi:hypothetical protein